MKKLYAVLLALALALGLTTAVAPAASASFKDGYTKNISASTSIGIATYPAYNRITRYVAAGTTYSNYNSNPSPQSGDITGAYIGSGYRCDFKWYEVTNGALYRSFTKTGPYWQGIGALDRDLLTIRCYRY